MGNKQQDKLKNSQYHPSFDQRNFNDHNYTSEVVKTTFRITSLENQNNQISIKQNSQQAPLKGNYSIPDQFQQNQPVNKQQINKQQKQPIFEKVFSPNFQNKEEIIKLKEEAEVEYLEADQSLNNSQNNDSFDDKLMEKVFHTQMENLSDEEDFIEQGRIIQTLEDTFTANNQYENHNLQNITDHSVNVSNIDEINIPIQRPLFTPTSQLYKFEHEIFLNKRPFFKVETENCQLQSLHNIKQNQQKKKGQQNNRSNKSNHNRKNSHLKGENATKKNNAKKNINNV